MRSIEDLDNGPEPLANELIENEPVIEPIPGRTGEPEPFTEPGPAAEPEPVDVPSEAPVAESTGSKAIDKYLELHGMLGSMVEFEGGESRSFHELSDESQLEILNLLADQRANSIEDQYNLTEHEIELLNGFRSTGDGLSLDEAINRLADRKVEIMMAMKDQLPKVDYMAQSADQVFLDYLRETEGSEELTEEELQEELEIAKSVKTFSNTVNVIRNMRIKEQEAKIAEHQRKLLDVQIAQREQENELIVQEVSNMREIAGWEIDDAVKNEVLADLVEYDNEGYTALDKALQDPQKAFQVAWFLKKGSQAFDQMEAYYKRMLKDVYEKGVKAGSTGKDSSKSVVVKKESGKSEVSKTTGSRSQKSTMTMDEL